MKTQAQTPPARPRTPPAAPPRPLRRPHLWLLVLPFAWQVGLVPVANDIALRPFGMPFPMVWQMLGIVFASLVFALVFHLDRIAGVEREEMRVMEELDAMPAEGEAR